jgi:lipopolysaccharide/colanic/teichoic acid biosynthesis glycosyltransferase
MSPCKRIIDVAVACVGLVSCLPLLAIAALLIGMDGHGSPIFQQRRIGRKGEIFILYKLRTMSSGSERLGFRTAENDNRVTKIGTFFRDSKIDEIPQLWNVIKGEMSLIGPRPLSVDETEYLIHEEQFSPGTPGLIPQVSPGLTGWEQCTRSSLHPYQHRFQLNHYYETHLCLWLDVWVLRRTFQVCPYVFTLSLLSAFLTLEFINSVLP